MHIEIKIDYRKDSYSNGSAISTAEEGNLHCYFKVWRDGLAIRVEFADAPEKDDILQDKVRSLIVKEYLRLCVVNGTPLSNSVLSEGTDGNGGRMQYDNALRSLMNICVDGSGAGDIYGRIYTMYAERPFPFYDTASLLLRMEQVYDTVEFPRSTTRHRVFRDRGDQFATDSERGMGDLQESYTTGGRATFMVKVEYRQHSTWQGTVTWVENDKKQSFRSSLELIRFIDSISGDDSEKAEEDAT